MPLYLSEADVRALVTVPDAINALEEAFRHWRLDGTEHRLLAPIEAGGLGAMRTGAASGVATRYLARADAMRRGIIGTGRRVRTQSLGIVLEEIAFARLIHDRAQERNIGTAFGK